MRSTRTVTQHTGADHWIFTATVCKNGQQLLSDMRRAYRRTAPLEGMTETDWTPMLCAPRGETDRRSRSILQEAGSGKSSECMRPCIKVTRPIRHVRESFRRSLPYTTGMVPSYGSLHVLIAIPVRPHIRKTHAHLVVHTGTIWEFAFSYPVSFCAYRLMLPSTPAENATVSLSKQQSSSGAWCR